MPTKWDAWYYTTLSGAISKLIAVMITKEIQIEFRGRWDVIGTKYGEEKLKKIKRVKFARPGF